MVCATIFAMHKRSYNLQTPYQFTSLLAIRLIKKFQRFLIVKVSQMLRSTKRNSAERRSSVQKSRFDHNIIIRG